MARDYKAYGTSFIEGLLAKVDNPEKKAQLKAMLLDDPDINKIVPDLGQGVFMQTDYSRSMNEAAQEKQKAEGELARLQSWWETNEAALKEYKELSENGRLEAARKGELPSGRDLPKDQPASLTMKEVEKYVGDREMLAAGYMNTLTKLGIKHYATFSEVLDPDAVVAHARSKNLPIDLAYDDLFKEQYTTRSTKDREAYEERLRKEGEERYAKVHANQPYPVRGGADTSPLAALDAIKSTSAAVDEAVAQYEQLSAGH